jgi:hypothetical protein
MAYNRSASFARIWRNSVLADLLSRLMRRWLDHTGVISAVSCVLQSLIERISGPNPRNDRVNPCLGKALHFDPEAGQMIGDDETNRLLCDGDRMYRSPYPAPEEV